jgi:hypothetical protein
MVRIEHQIGPCHRCKHFPQPNKPMAVERCQRPELKPYGLVISGLCSCNFHEPRRL